MNPGMIKKLKKMQEDMMREQARLESKEYFGKASGITVIMQGTRQVIDVKINEEMLEEIEMLQDAILLAFNDALKQVEDEHQETMGQFTAGMGGFGF